MARMSVAQRFAFIVTILVPTVIIVGYFAWLFTAPVRGRPESQVFVIVLFAILLEAFPFILVGALVASVIEVLVTPEQVRRLIPRNRVLAVGMGALLGAIFPVCECGVIPVVRRLIRKGVPLPAAVSYLLAAPIVNPVVIVSTIIAFRGGAESILVPVLRVVLGVSIAIVVGLLVGRMARQEELLTEAARPQVVPEAGADPPAETAASSAGVWAPVESWRGKVGAIMTHAAGEFIDVGRYLVLGSVLAASMQTFVPRQVLLDLGGNLTASVVVMMGLAFVLSLCSEADAFVARSFMQFGTAAKLSFLVLGPMLDIKLIMMYLGVFRRRLIVVIIASVLVLNFIVALVTGLALGSLGLSGLP